MEEFNSGDYTRQLEDTLKEQQSQLTGMATQQSGSLFQNNNDNNLIVWQLEVDNVLERIEHLLKGEIVGYDEDGSQIYVKPEDTSLITLNSYGVQLVMNIISFYLNRNTILSHYKEERINKILFDLGNKLANLIYINYEKMGMDSIEKRSRYPMLVINILNTVESTYNRALRGGERESLRTARVVTQNDPLGYGGGRGNQNMSNNNSKAFRLLRPSTWV